jgi:glycosyltransferase involved in cell wall biosynthesis
MKAKVLVLSDYNNTLNNKLPEIETFIGLKNAGVEISIIALGRDENIQYIRNNNIEITNLSPKSWYDYSYIQFVREKIKKEKFNILHLMYGKTMRNGVFAAFGLDVKLVLYLGSTSVHWHDITSYFKFLNPRVDRILCNSNHVYKHMKQQLIFSKHKAVKIYRGIDTSWYEDWDKYDLTKLGIPKNSIVILSISRNIKIKGAKYYLEATHHIPYNENVHFIHIGNKMDTDEMNDLKNKSKFKDNIHILGHRKDAIEILKSADIYVQTSLKEGLGRAISEAAALGKPIVMTNAGGCTELIEDEKGGFVAKKENPKDIASKLSKLINDEILRKKMGENAYSFIKSNFNINDTVKEIQKEYNILLNPE